MIANESEIRIESHGVHGLDLHFFERRPEQVECGLEFVQIDHIAFLAGRFENLPFAAQP